MVDHNHSASLEGQGPDATSYLVGVCSIDDYLRDAPSKDVGSIKIDVARHEPSAVRGMLNTLRDKQPSVLIEILDAGIGSEVAKLIDGIGYDFYQIDENRGLVPTTRLEPLGGANWNNLLCTPGQLAEAGLHRFLAS